MAISKNIRQLKHDICPFIPNDTDFIRFTLQSPISGRRINEIVQTAGLARKQIRNWFTKKEKKIDMEKENINPNKIYGN